MARKKVKRTTQARANRIENARRYRQSGGLTRSDLRESNPFGLTKSDLLQSFRSMSTKSGSMFVAIEERKARKKSRKTGNPYFYDLFKDKYFR